eukprot:12895018-Prorocentrum_lima.AAC.1
MAVLAECVSMKVQCLLERLPVALTLNPQALHLAMENHVRLLLLMAARELRLAKAQSRFLALAKPPGVLS